MRVDLIYYKRSGKYYSDGHYDSEFESLEGIWDEVRRMRAEGRLPDLADQSEHGGTYDNFIISVDVPDHPNRHPHLVV